MCTPGDRQARDLNPPGERRPDSEATCEAAGRRERTALMCVHGPAGPSSFHRGQCPRSQACPVAQAEAHAAALAAGDAASGSAGGMIVRRKRASAPADILALAYRCFRNSCFLGFVGVRCQHTTVEGKWRIDLGAAPGRVPAPLDAVCACAMGRAAVRFVLIVDAMRPTVAGGGFQTSGSNCARYARC